MSFIPDPGTDFTVGQEPAIASALGKLAAYLKTTVYGISGYRTPSHSAAVGGSPTDPHTRGEAADIGVGANTRASAANVPESTLEKFGLYRPFDPTGDPNNPEVNHVQLLSPGKTRPRSFVVTASVFGGPGDPSTGTTGYRGDDLTKSPNSFAELSRNPGALDFSALGGLPYDTPITVTNLANGQSATLYKRDVGAGGPGIQGKPRAIDVWYQAAQQLGLNGLGLVRVTVGSNVATPGLTRPGGESATQSGSDPAALFTSWNDLVNAPRTVPVPTTPKAAFQWWLNSYTGRW